MAKDSRTSQFTLKTLLGAVVVVAVILTALTHASPIWVGIFFTSTVVILLLAISRALATHGRTRAFWAAFAICGGAYFCLTFTTLGRDGYYSTWNYSQRSAVPRLLTEAVLYWMYEAMPPLATRYTVGSNVSVEWHGSWWPATLLDVKGDQYNIQYVGSYAEWVPRARVRNPDRDYESFAAIGNTTWTLLLGLCGGLAARAWWRPADATTS
jgi:hypothetical protein